MIEALFASSLSFFSKTQLYLISVEFSSKPDGKKKRNKLFWSYELIVEIFITQMSVTSSIYFKHTFINSQQTDFESTSTKIENKNILVFTGGVFIKTVSNYCC